LKALVLDTLFSIHSRRFYAPGLDEFFAWYRKEGRGPFSKAVVQRYRSELLASGLGAGSINHRLTALRKLATEAADNGLMDIHLAAGIGRPKSRENKKRPLGAVLAITTMEVRTMVIARLGLVRMHPAVNLVPQANEPIQHY
jgi:hypothetical protein